MSSDSVLDLILSAIISSNVFQTDDDKIWATIARLVPSSSPEEVVQSLRPHAAAYTKYFGLLRPSIKGRS